jgi:hypothetical protein
MQLLGIQPLLERTLIEKTLGLSHVSAFAFTISIVQTCAGLVLLPYISKVKSKIIGARNMIEWKIVKKLSITLLLITLFVSGVLSGIVLLVIPIYNSLTDKYLPISTTLILVVYVTTVASVFCSSVSPAISKGGAEIKSNFHALLIFSPLFLAQVLPFEVQQVNVFLYLIATVAIFSMAYRIYYIIRIKNIT